MDNEMNTYHKNRFKFTKIYTVNPRKLNRLILEQSETSPKSLKEIQFESLTKSQPQQMQHPNERDSRDQFYDFCLLCRYQIQCVISKCIFTGIL